MDAADFPYDVQWTDIDVMSSGLDYTYDEKNFANLPSLIRQLQANGKHYVNIIDPGISSVQTPGSYFPFDEGVNRGVFIRKFNSTEFIIGKVESLSLLNSRKHCFFCQGLARSNSIS